MAINFGKMIGPLPLGMWLVVGAGGAAVLYFTWNAQNSAPETVEDVSGEPGVGTGAVGGGYTYQPPPEGGVQPTDFETNEEWGRAAINWLISEGKDPGVANNAITKALQGGQDEYRLTTQEYAMWLLALARFGAPPSPVFPTPPVTSPTTPTPPKPPQEGPTSPPKPTSAMYIENLRPGIVRVRWNPVPWAARYDVYLNGVFTTTRVRSLEYWAFRRPPLTKGRKYTVTVYTRNILNQRSAGKSITFTMT